MRLVVADTGPLNYLVLIEQVAILPTLFEKIFVPQIVRDELRHDEAPENVRRWIADPPSWVEIVPADHDVDDPALVDLDDGERAAIQLAARIGAELLLIDDREAVNVARTLGFAVTGTLGILDLAASRGMIRLVDAVERLKNTSFRCRPDVLDALLPVTHRTKGLENSAAS
jgi:predicted nucleic acid-binding protein